MAPADVDIVIDNLEEGILFLDKERHVVTINKAALEMIGQKESVDIREDIIDQLCPDLFPGASCAKDCEESGICSLMDQDIEKERVEEITFSGLNGKIVTLRMRAIALSSGEQHLARIAILLTDCSHERELEEEVKGVKARIRNALESAGLISSDTTAL
jgi:PAS domain-containing protein